MLKIQKKDTNQTFNDVAFTKQGYSFNIEKYFSFDEKMIETKKKM